MDWVIVIAAAIISGILGVLISIIYHRRREKYQMKINTLKDFAGYRYDIKGENFTKALNEIFIIFNDSTEVKQALKKFHEHISSPVRGGDLANQYLTELFKSMCHNLNIKTSDFTDIFFLRPFNTKNY